MIIKAYTAPKRLTIGYSVHLHLFNTSVITCLISQNKTTAFNMDILYKWAFFLEKTMFYCGI